MVTFLFLITTMSKFKTVLRKRNLPIRYFSFLPTDFGFEKHYFTHIFPPLL